MGRCTRPRVTPRGLGLCKVSEETLRLEPIREALIGNAARCSFAAAPPVCGREKHLPL
jgi:hypothetical protein